MAMRLLPVMAMVVMVILVCPWVCQGRVHMACCQDLDMDIIMGKCRRIHRMVIRISISCHMGIMRIRMRR